MRPKLLSKLFSPRKHSKVFSYILILLLASFVFFCLYYLNYFFQVKTILLIQDRSNKTLRGLEGIKGTNILFINLKSVEKTLTLNNPEIQIEKIEKIFPDKLIIRLIELEPVASLKLNQGYAILDSGARVLKKSKNPTNLPSINFYQKFDYLQVTPGVTLDYKELLTALSLLKICQELNLTVDSIDISGLSMIVFNLQDRRTQAQTKKILFTSEKDIQKQSFELETIIRQFKVEAKEFKQLDLRFDKPVVNF